MNYQFLTIKYNKQISGFREKTIDKKFNILKYNINNFHICTLYLNIIKSFIYPTDAQLNCSKRMLKFALKFTLKVLQVSVL
jgi:hypothetical protein